MNISTLLSLCMIALVSADSKPSPLTGKMVSDKSGFEPKKLPHRNMDNNKHTIQPRDIQPHFQQGSLTHGFGQQTSGSFQAPASFSTFSSSPSTTYRSPQPSYHQHEDSEESEEEEEKETVLFPVPVEVPVHVEHQGHHQQHHQHLVSYPYSAYPQAPYQAYPYATYGQNVYPSLPYQISLNHGRHAAAHPSPSLSHGRASNPALILLSHLLRARALRPVLARDLDAQLAEDPALLRLALAKTLSDPSLPQAARSAHSIGSFADSSPLLNHLLPSLADSVLNSLNV